MSLVNNSLKFTSWYANMLKFFAEKMWVAFAVQKLLTFFQQKISEYCISKPLGPECRQCTKVLWWFLRFLVKHYVLLYTWLQKLQHFKLIKLLCYELVHSSHDSWQMVDYICLILCMLCDIPVFDSSQWSNSLSLYVYWLWRYTGKKDQTDTDNNANANATGTQAKSNKYLNIYSTCSYEKIK